MAAPTPANPSLSPQTYDPLGHQTNVAFKVTNIQTDTSVTPNVSYGDLGIQVDVTASEPADIFSNAASITAATTFSGVPTISQLAANSSVLLANPGSMATFIAEIAVAAAFVGTLSFYGLEPDGATLQLIGAHQRGVGTTANSTAISTAVALNQTWMGSAATFKTIYVVCTAFTSGSVSVQLGLSAAPYALAILNTINALITNANANGQTTMDASAPVVIASNQTAIPMKVSTVAVYSLASTQSTGATQNSGDLAVGAYREISIDINTTAQSGTSPTLQLFYERKAADGIYYVLWQSAVLTAAANTLSTSIGAGMAYNQSLGVTGRLRWVVGGSATPTYTFSANISGK